MYSERYVQSFVNIQIDLNGADDLTQLLQEFERDGLLDSLDRTMICSQISLGLIYSTYRLRLSGVHACPDKLSSTYPIVISD